MILNDGISVETLLHSMEVNHARIAFLVNDQSQLVGCVTQGDIIRAFLSGASKRFPARNIAKVSPFYVYDDASATMRCKEIIQKNKIHAVPILNKANQIVKVFEIWDLLEEK
jgi:CBS domain-containing protein